MFDTHLKKPFPAGRFTIATALGLSLFGFLTCGAPWVGSDIAPGITADKVRMVELGMNEEQVVRMLGAPLMREPLPGGRVRLHYARTVERVRAYPTLSVLLENDAVQAVVAHLHYFWGADEDALFVRRKDLQMESPDFSKRFPSCGPNQ